MYISKQLVHTLSTIALVIINKFLGGGDYILYTLIILMILDYISGIMYAIVSKNISSSIGFKGIFKKCMILCLIGIAHLLDTYIIETAQSLRALVILFYISNEGISILENATLLGLPIPEKIRNIIQKIDNDK